MTTKIRFVSLRCSAVQARFTRLYAAWQELLNLLPFLKQLKDAQDVRPLIRQTFRLQEFVNSL